MSVSDESSVSETHQLVWNNSGYLCESWTLGYVARSRTGLKSRSVFVLSDSRPGGVAIPPGDNREGDTVLREPCLLTTLPGKLRPTSATTSFTHPASRRSGEGRIENKSSTFAGLFFTSCLDNVNCLEIAVFSVSLLDIFVLNQSPELML